MKSFYDRNIFTRKKFHKEIQVDFSKIEICLLQNRIKQLESYINCLDEKKENNIIQNIEFGVDENDKRYVKNKNKYVLYY